MSPGTLLLVDDEPSLISLLVLVFETEGFRVLSALSGAAGIETFARAPVDVVVLDFLMPGLDGGQVAEQMRALRPEVPIVMLSACLTVPDSARERVDAFVEKGAGTEALLNAVKKVLRRSKPHNAK